MRDNASMLRAHAVCQRRGYNDAPRTPALVSVELHLPCFSAHERFYNAASVLSSTHKRTQYNRKARGQGCRERGDMTARVDSYHSPWHAI